MNKHNKQRRWDLHFLKMAELVASKSSDPSLQVGCVIVDSDNVIRGTGYNGFARGIKYTEKRLQRPAKYDYMVHAELNASLHVGRDRAQGCTAYVACTPREKGGNAPCLECTKALIQVGVTTIVEWNTPSVQSKGDVGTWRDKLKASVSMLTEAGVKLRLITPE